MNQERYVAAIEISSSKIIAVVGKVQNNGQLEIIATEQERWVEGVRYGIIQNPEETATRIRRILDRLQRKPAVQPREITGLYVGLSGRSLRSLPTEVGLNLPPDTEINDDILGRLRALALKAAIDSSLEVVDAIPRIYTVGKSQTHSPKGAIGDRINAIYDLIVCRPELRRNIERTLTDKVGIHIEGYIVTALSTAQVILSSEQKRLGCMFVDMGAETTEVSIYKGGHLQYFATLPLGGRNITRDITSERLLEEKAEELKITIGNAIPRDISTSMNVDGVRTSEVLNLVVARSEEIVANIVEQISYAGLKEADLPAGVICIGGGSKLNGILELISNQTGMKVERGGLPSYIRIEDGKAHQMEMMEVASVLYSGGMNSEGECLAKPKAELPKTGEGNPEEREEEERKTREKAQKSKSSFFKSWGEKISSIFGAPDDDNSDLIE